MFGLSSAINKVCDGFDEEASSGCDENQSGQEWSSGVIEIRFQRPQESSRCESTYLA